MTVKELLDYLEKNDIPMDAEVCVSAECGDDEERTYTLCVTRSEFKYPEEAIWEFDRYEDVYDEDAILAYNKEGKITGLCIWGSNG